MKKSIIALLLVILPIENLILAILASTYSNVYVLAYIPMILGYIIYVLNSKDNKTIKKILFFITFLSIIVSILSLYSLMDVSGGIDSIGDALAHFLIFTVSRLIYKIISVILLIMDNKEYIFRKKTMIILIFIVVSISLFTIIKESLTTIKVDKNIPSVNDFEKELIDRKLISDHSNYKLYGISKNSKKAITLNFKENSTEQFPLYIYVADKSINDGKDQWIIYYINGEIYAVWGCYYECFNVGDIRNKEEKIIFDYPYYLRTEKDTITVYNPKKNRFETGEYIWSGSFNYYAKNIIDTSTFIDILEVADEEHFLIKKIDRIDAESLRY